MNLMEKMVRMMDEQTMRSILSNGKCDQKCEILHAGDCNLKAIIQFAMGVRGVFKMYLLAHLVPLLLFKFSKLRKNPRKELWKFMKGLASSLTFAGLSSAIVRRVACFLTKYSSYNYTIARYPASIAGLSILFESPTRQIEIALYCVSKGWEAGYGMLKRRNYPVAMRGGNLWINAVSLAVIAFAFMHDPSFFREGYRNVLSKIFGDV